MLRYFYCFLLYLISPFVIARLYVRSKKFPEHWQRKYEHFGIFSPLSSSKPVIWVHSVSVGETIASAPLVKRLQIQYPDHQVVITTMTATGAAQVEKLHGCGVRHLYVPYDIPGSVKRFLNRLRPVIAIFVDTELWPNTVDALHKRRIPILIVNARLSQRSAKGYGRFTWLVTPMLEKIDMVSAQNRATAERFLQLGLPSAQLDLTGSIKFDMDIPEQVSENGIALRSSWRKAMGPKTQFLVAASTHAGEEQQVINAYKKIINDVPNLRLVLVPRHPERFDEVFNLLEANDLSTIRFSASKPPNMQTQVILGDVMGQMMTFFKASDLAFMGGSFVPVGGHNMLEPAILGLPVFTGPNVFNFADISKELVKAGGMRIVQDSEELAQQIINLMNEPGLYEAMSEKGEVFVKNNRGAIGRVLKLIEHLLPRRL